MVDAPWLSPGDNSGAFFIFWSLVIGHWLLVICYLLVVVGWWRNKSRIHAFTHSKVKKILNFEF